MESLHSAAFDPRPGWRPVAKCGDRRPAPRYDTVVPDAEIPDEPPSAEELRADAANGLILIARDDGHAVACGSLRMLEAGTAEVNR